MNSIRFRMVAAGLASVAVLSLACGSEDVMTPTPGGPGSATPVGGQSGIISGYDAVYFSLRTAGGQVEKGDEPTGKEALFSVKGRSIRMNGQGVLVYEYQGVSAAEDEAGRISPDGSEIRSPEGRISHVDWVAYRQANTIVLYVGNDPAVLGILGKALGEPFAGGGKESEPATATPPTPAPGSTPMKSVARAIP
ncbi:MAG: hypothetical protein HYY34_04460 [Chloroflexi bacterium]|nr:hypothetical protein [Chloroflexota bacterium]